MEVTAFGDWNAECAQAMMVDIRKHASAFNGQPWASLVNLHGWELGTPEFGESIRTGAKEMVGKGLRREAFVGATNSLSVQQLSSVRPQVPGSDYDFAFFDSTLEALQWLKQEGFSPFAE